MPRCDPKAILRLRSKLKKLLMAVAPGDQLRVLSTERQAHDTNRLTGERQKLHPQPPILTFVAVAGWLQTYSKCTQVFEKHCIDLRKRKPVRTVPSGPALPSS